MNLLVSMMLAPMSFYEHITIERPSTKLSKFMVRACFLIQYFLSILAQV